MKVNLTTTSGEGGVLIASDDLSKRSLNVIVGHSGGETSVNLNVRCQAPAVSQPWPRYINQPRPNSATRKQPKV